MNLCEMSNSVKKLTDAVIMDRKFVISVSSNMPSYEMFMTHFKTFILMFLVVLLMIAFGLVSGLLSVLYAAMVEIIRKHVLINGGSLEQTISGVIFHASSLSILVQIPQYIFIGIADTFVLITGNTLMYFNHY